MAAFQQNAAAFARQANDKLHRAVSDPQILSEVASYKWLMAFARYALTAAIIGFGIFLTKKYRQAKTKSEIDSWTYIQQLWLGTQAQGLLQLTFRVWLYTVIAGAGMVILNRLALV